MPLWDSSVEKGLDDEFICRQLEVELQVATYQNMRSRLTNFAQADIPGICLRALEADFKRRAP